MPDVVIEPEPLDPGTLRIIPIGGLGEVGRNMTSYEIDGKILIVDCGVLFPEEHQPGVDLILPDFGFLRDRLDDVVAVVLTHGHEDHIGAVPYLLKLRADIPLVHSDDSAVGRLAAEHLLERGFTHFGCYGPADAIWMKQRRSAFERAVIQGGGDCAHFEKHWKIQGPTAWDHAEEELAAWLAALPKPAGVFTANDQLGQRLLSARSAHRRQQRPAPLGAGGERVAHAGHGGGHVDGAIAWILRRPAWPATPIGPRRRQRPIVARLRASHRWASAERRAGVNCQLVAGQRNQRRAALGLHRYVTDRSH